MKRFFRNIPWRNILIIGLVAVLGIGAVVGITSIAKNEKKEISSTVFKRGAIDQNGFYVESDNSLYTKDLIECQGLEIAPDFESTGTYQVFYYNSDKQFIGATEVMNSQSDGVYMKGESYPLAKYCRIMITPETPKDEDGYVIEDYKIKFYEVTGIANKFTISVNKNQDFVDPRKVDLIKKYDAELGIGYSAGDDNKLVPETKPAGMTVIVDVSFMEELTFKFGSADAVVNYFIDADGNVLSRMNIFEGDTDKVVAVPDGAVYLYCFMAQDNPYSVFQTK